MKKREEMFSFNYDFRVEVERGRGKEQSKICIETRVIKNGVLQKGYSLPTMLTDEAGIAWFQERIQFLNDNLLKRIAEEIIFQVGMSGEVTLYQSERYENADPSLKPALKENLINMKQRLKDFYVSIPAEFQELSGFETRGGARGEKHYSKDKECVEFAEAVDSVKPFWAFVRKRAKESDYSNWEIEAIRNSDDFRNISPGFEPNHEILMLAFNGYQKGFKVTPLGLSIAHVAFKEGLTFSIEFLKKVYQRGRRVKQK